MLALLTFPATNGFASLRADFPNIIEQFRMSDVVWEDAQLLFMGGIPMHTTSFMSSLPADSVARQLSGSPYIFDRILTMPGQLVLSGMKDGWHWLAVVRAKTEGADGYVSAMRAGPVSPVKSQPWLPLHTPVVFSFNDVAGDTSVTQHVHRVPWPLHMLSTKLKEQLVHHGWRRQAESPDSNDHNGGSKLNGPWHWYRSHEQIFITADTDYIGTLIFTHRTARSTGQ